MKSITLKTAHNNR